MEIIVERMPYKDKPLIHGNSLNEEIHYKVKSFIQGEPLVNIRGNHLQREIPYIMEPLKVLYM